MPTIDQLANVRNTKKEQSKGPPLKNRALTKIMKQKACSFAELKKKIKSVGRHLIISVKVI